MNGFNKNEIQRIGILRALYLGDMLCIIPAVRALRKAFPHARITLVGLPWERNFVKRFSIYFDDFIEFPGWPGLPEQEVIPDKLLEFIAAMQYEHFDLFLQMQGNGTETNAMSILFGARYTAGLREPGEQVFNPVYFPESGDDEHEILRFLKLTDALEIPRQGTALEFPILPEEQRNFEMIQQSLNLLSHNYICIHPGARNVLRRWPAANFAAIANNLIAREYTIVLTGSEDERDLLREVASQIQQPVINIVDTCGQIGIGELAQIITHSTLLVSNDTGVSHVAAALQVPSVIIFSTYSDPNRWSPLNTNLHKVIPPELANDVAFVWKHVEQQLLYKATSFMPGVAPDNLPGVSHQ